jgi:hypothetical protein
MLRQGQYIQILKKKIDKKTDLKKHRQKNIDATSGDPKFTPKTSKIIVTPIAHLNNAKVRANIIRE